MPSYACGDQGLNALIATLPDDVRTKIGPNRKKEELAPNSKASSSSDLLEKIISNFAATTDTTRSTPCKPVLQSVFETPKAVSLRNSDLLTQAVRLRSNTFGDKLPML